MKKNTAYDRFFDYLDVELQCNNCPLTREECEELGDIGCGEHLKQYFQQQADIPDGWEVVKELCKELKEDIKYENSWVGSSRNEEVEREERVVVYERLVKELEQKLQQAGIEVE